MFRYKEVVSVQRKLSHGLVDQQQEVEAELDIRFCLFVLATFKVLDFYI